MANKILSMAPRNSQRSEEIRAIAARLNVAIKLRNARSTHLDLASGQSKGQTSRLLNGKRTQNVNASVLRSYATELRVSYRWLAHGAGSIDDIDESESPEHAALMASMKSDTIDVAAAYHRIFPPEVVLAVRELAAHDGIDIGSRSPAEWARTLFDRMLQIEATTRATIEATEAHAQAKIQKKKRA